MGRDAKAGTGSGAVRWRVGRTAAAWCLAVAVVVRIAFLALQARCHALLADFVPGSPFPVAPLALASHTRLFFVADLHGDALFSGR